MKRFILLIFVIIQVLNLLLKINESISCLDEFEILDVLACLNELVKYTFSC